MGNACWELYCLEHGIQPDGQVHKLDEIIVDITVCPRSSDPLYEVTYFIKWVTTSWTYSMLCINNRYFHKEISNLTTAVDADKYPNQIK